MKRALMLLPLLIFLAVAVFLFRGLSLDPTELPSALIDKPFPRFTLSDVKTGQPVSQQDLLGQPALVNVWATWCVSCKVEHPLLNQLAQAGITIHGVNYRDDKAAAQKWLAEFHNPYQLNISDPSGALGLDLGVYGAPETFLVDARGIIRHKYVGVIDAQVWREQLAPLYQQLLDEAGR
jgi:cytochrome c biogenesis protein CcmG/thiol:disulfide interchange protein DsbE